MRKFITKILSFSIIFFAGAISLVLITNIIKYNFNYVYNSQSKNLQKIEKIDVGFFGDSHLKGSINTYEFENIAKKNTFSFSKGGRPLYYSSALIERMLSLNSRMDVVVDLGSNNLPFQGVFTYLEDDLFHDSAFQDYLSSNTYLFDFDDLIRFLSINFFKTIQSCFKGSMNFNFFLYDGIDFNKNDYLINLNLDVSKTNNEIKKYSTAEHILNYDFELNRLLSVIKKFPKSKFIIIRPPETELAKLIYPQNYFFIFESELNKFKNVYFKDFSCEVMNVEEDFNDLTHLSVHGMKKFTSIFSKFYLDLENK